MKAYLNKRTGVASILADDNYIGVCGNFDGNISYSMGIDSGHSCVDSGKTGVDCYVSDRTDAAPPYPNPWLPPITTVYEPTKVWMEATIEKTLQDLDKEIDRVLFHEPATIILWKDKTKTVVKTQNGEPFDKEKGFLMALAKRLGEDKGNYNKIIKKWCETDEDN